MSNIPSAAVEMMRQEIRNDPSFVLELAQMAGLPTAEQLQTYVQNAVASALAAEATNRTNAISSAISQEAQARATADSANSTAAQNALTAANNAQTTATNAASAASTANNQLSNLPDATPTQKGVTIFAGNGNATAGRAVQATDSRLSNDRNPTAHNQAISTITGLTEALATKLGTDAILSGSATVTIPALLLGGTYSFDIAVTGARAGMVPIVNFPTGFLAFLSTWEAVIPSNDIVRVNLKAGLAIAQGGRTFNARVIK